METAAEVAIKVESVNASYLRLFHEVKVCKLLVGSVGVPNVHWYGVEGKYSVAVFDLLGPSLQDLFDYSGFRFSLKTVLMLAEQMVTRMEYVHNKGLVHRNIKPSHFAIGLGAKADVVHLIDFGFAKHVCESKARTYLHRAELPKVVGTLRYMSMNAHRGLEETRSDDLESLGYVLTYFLRGRLPWQGMQGSTESERHKKILDKKMSTSMHELCCRAPRELAELCAYSERSHCDANPDYTYLKRSVRHALSRFGSNHVCRFDWTGRASRSWTTACSSSRLQCVSEETLEEGGQMVCAC
eukprot:TRINITY_DN8222_c1_g1_i5.p1 TRINITY_DN8222_c1_g1~~TRINITY_DN8222_c1_g1_i5.p1  ORF type:complete len:345 (+),score=49.91 TRINITY_DN8222_c1_g1_i5:143-1036(+)